MQKRKKDDAPRQTKPLDLSAFAKLAGVSNATITRAVQDGRLRESIVRVGKRWKVADAELALVELRERTRSKASERESAPTPTNGSSAAPILGGYQEARAAKTRREAELAGIKLAKLRRELVPLAEVAGLWEETLGNLRRRLEVLPDRLAPELAAATEANEVRTRLETEIRSVLEDAANAIAKASV